MSDIGLQPNEALCWSQYSERGIPEILYGPEAADKKAQPRKTFVSAHLLEGVTQTLLPYPQQRGILQHKYHQESIEKDDEWKYKIQLFRRHNRFIGSLRKSKSPVRLTVFTDMVKCVQKGSTA